MKQPIVASVLAVAVAATGVFLAWGPPVGAQGGGSISGEVKFAGAAPAPKVVKVNKDNAVCGDEKKIAEVVVGPGGGLANTLVSVSDAKGAKAAAPAEASPRRWCRSPTPRAPSPRSPQSSTRRGASSIRTLWSWRRAS
jgi:hypothetical protein